MPSPAVGVQQLELDARGPYSLAESVRFLEGFAPAAHDAADETDETDVLDLAFALEGGWETVGVRVRTRPGGVGVEVFGPEVDLERVRAQVARILSLDVDGTGFSEVGNRDPVVGELQARLPGLRPVCFLSAYEAAAWALMSHRIRIRQAAKIKREMTVQLGEPVDIAGRRHHAFPAPRVLAELESFPGLTERKVANLRALTEAAEEGFLDGGRLRAMEPDDARAELQSLPGVGPFSADLILLRGAGAPDVLPGVERRLGRAIANAYDLPEEPPAKEVERLADRWRPYRTWVAFLLRVALERDTEDIARGGRPARAGAG